MNLKTEVGDIMSTDLTTVTEDTPIKQLRNMFKSRNIHHLPVENNVGELIGIVSTEDLARANHFPIAEAELLTKQIMTVSPQKVSANTPIKKVIDSFLEGRFRAIPVVNDDGVLIGIVSPYDIMALMMGEKVKTGD